MINLSKNRREAVGSSLLDRAIEAFSPDTYLAENVEDYVTNVSGIQIPIRKQLFERGVARVLIKDVSLSRVVERGIIRPYWFNLEDSTGEVEVYWNPIFELARRDDGFRSGAPLSEVSLKYTFWSKSTEVENVVTKGQPRKDNYFRREPSQELPGQLLPA